MTSSSSELPSSLLEALKELRTDEEMADIVLVCDGGEIKAHKKILSCRSIYFKKMFTNNFTESQTNRVQLTEISADVMNLILDYIYSESMDKISKEDLDQIIQVHQWSHLFQLKDLANHCWKLIIKSLDIGNVLYIWNAVLLYGEENEFFVIVQFLLENLETVVKVDILSALSALQFKQVKEEIEKSSISVTDTILAGILKWYKNNPEENNDLEKFLLHLNYDYVTNRYMKELAENENSVFTESFYKEMFLSRIVSPSRTKAEPRKANLKAKILSIKYKLSLNFFRFDGYIKRLNNYLMNEENCLKVIDVFNKKSDQTISGLPFLISDKIFIPLQFGSHLYIIGGVPVEYPENNPNTSFILYDWQSNTISVKPSIPTFNATRVYAAVIGDKICVVEGYKENPKLFIYSISREEWKTINCNIPHYVINCMVLRGVLYFLSMSNYDKSHHLYQLINETVHLVCNVPIPCYDGEFMEYPYQGARSTQSFVVQKKIVVHQDKLFIFMFSSKRDLKLYTVWNPDNLHIWRLKKLSYDFSEHDRLECFSLPGDAICFYSYSSNKVFAFQEDHGGNMEELAYVREPLHDEELQELNFLKVECLLLFKT